MLSKRIFFIFSLIFFVESISIEEDPCEGQISKWSDECSGTIIVSRSCQSSFVHLGNTSFKSCDHVYLMWSYPLNNLTMIIQTKFSEEYQIRLDNQPTYDIQKYQIVNGKEIRINSTEEFVTITSDSNFQIKMKLQAETTISYYGFPIVYNVTKSLSN